MKTPRMEIRPGFLNAGCPTWAVIALGDRGAIQSIKYTKRTSAETCGNCGFPLDVCDYLDVGCPKGLQHP